MIQFAYRLDNLKYQQNLLMEQELSKNIEIKKEIEKNRVNIQNRQNLQDRKTELRRQKEVLLSYAALFCLLLHGVGAVDSLSCFLVSFSCSLIFLLSILYQSVSF